VPVLRVDRAQLHFELAGAGAPLVLVHGSWDDASTWSRVAPAFAASHRVLTYDRRGHSRSAQAPGRGTLAEDAHDLALLLERLGLAPAHVACSSLGGTVALRLAGTRPELFASLAVHEPPLFALLARDPDAAGELRAVRAALDDVREALERGDDEAGARTFVERVAFEPGAWTSLSRGLRAMFVANAHTFLDEVRGGDQDTLDLEPLRSFARPVLLTRGTESPPYFQRPLAQLAGALPRAELRVFAGAGHVPHATHPEEYVRTIAAFVARACQGRPAAWMR
jgi:pimeloyl-ACP methyl ester carboxylesterase